MPLEEGADEIEPATRKFGRESLRKQKSLKQFRLQLSWP